MAKLTITPVFSDTSEIILKFWFNATETFLLLLSMLKIVVLLNIFVKTNAA